MSTPLGDMTTIPVSLQPIQAVPPLGDDSSVVIYNQDLTNVIYASYSRWFQPGAANSVPIQPLTFATLSAKRAIYLGSTVSVLPAVIVPEGTQLQPSPSQIAQQISALGLATLAQQITQQTVIPNNISTTGVPLLTQSTILVNLPAQGIAASGNYQSAKISTNQIGYELLITPYYPVTNGANPFVYVVIGWWDSVSGLLVDKQTFVTCTNSHVGINGLPTRIKGPSKADQVQLTIYNQDTVQGIATQIVLSSNSRVLTQDYIDWPVDQSENAATIVVPGHTLPAFILPDSRTLAVALNTALAASGQDGWLIPPHSGLAYINMLETGVAAANIAVSWQPLPSSIYGGTTPWLVNDVMVAGNPNKLNYPQVIMPNAPTQLNIKNNGSVAASYVALITGA
jgi:hypothetical protein